MTVIAWDGKTLAADKASTSVGHASTVTKIHRVPGGLVGVSGDCNGAVELLKWFRDGRDPNALPACQKTDDAGYAVFIDHERRIWSYSKSATPMHAEDEKYASGAGRDYALAAMHLGFDARRAVEVACHFDAFCGNGIDTLELDQ